MKALYERVRKETGEVGNLIHNIAEKGYPAEFCEHLRNKVNDVQSMAENAASFYASLVIQTEVTTAIDAKSLTNEIKTKHKALEDAYGDARQKVFSAVRKIGSGS